MKKEIFNILEEYENKPADESFVINILTILRKEYHAENNLKKVIVCRCDKKYINKRKWVGWYYRKEKIINIDIATLDYKEKSILENNIKILIMILHEFVHVLQEKNIEKDNFENKLIKISDKIEKFDEDIKTSDAHDYIPDERLANIKSHLMCIDVLSHGFIKYQDELYKIKKYLHLYLLRGYEFDENNSINSPLEIILKRTNLYQDNIDIFKNKNYSLAERLLYGLPITKNEYNNLLSEYKNYSNKDKKLKIKII